MCTMDTCCEMFKSWQCVTIQLKHREVDLVVKNQSQMDNLISLILYKTHSLDGMPGSSLPIEEYMELKKGNIEEVRHMLVKKTLFKFKV
jgi:hypothetical protein